MNKKDRRKLKKRKSRINKRLDKNSWPKGTGPVFSSTDLKYEISDRIVATNAGGVGAVHAMVRRLGFDTSINRALSLLKIKLPYHESDHILNIVYNIMAGGTCLEDLELRRQDEAYMNMLGAERIPDPTTAGDFLRRFDVHAIEALMNVTNNMNERLWRSLPKKDRTTAYIDADGTLVATDGHKKEGMDLSYKGIWGYAPLVISLANFQQPLYLVNRPGNATSSLNAADWIDKAIQLCGKHFEKVLVRGDTDFSQTVHFDRWTEEGVGFVFGYAAYQNLVNQVDLLEDSAWSTLDRSPSWTIRTEPRAKREDFKKQKVIERNLKNIELISESIAEFPYQPARTKKTYRMIVVRKDLAVERGEPTLIPNEVRYLFYVTNREDLTCEEVVKHANARCHQENLIEQLKNGVNALRVPVYDLVSNWAYMVVASLAWSFKAWFGLTLRGTQSREKILRMKFKRFLNSLMLVPCQFLKTARQCRLRILSITPDIRLLFSQVMNPRYIKPG